MSDRPLSPCIKQCKLDSSGRYCTGCLRTLPEISGWGSASDAQKQMALDRIAALSQSSNLRTLGCSRCGQPFRCGSGGKRGGCWCADLPPLLPADNRGGDCLCPACLAAVASQADTQ